MIRLEWLEDQHFYLKITLSIKKSTENKNFTQKSKFFSKKIFDKKFRKFWLMEYDLFVTPPVK